MKSIANQEFTVTTTEGTEYNIVSIDIYEEFELDKYFHMLMNAFVKIDYDNDTPLYEFIVNALKGEKETLKFAELGKKIVKEYNDSPIYFIVTDFFNVINAIEKYRNELKKK